MSETSNGMPDLSSGDSEPSMEDILASIRKIIADDKTESPEFNAEPDVVAPTEELAVEEPTSFIEQVEDQQFEIPEVEGTSQAFDELESPAENILEDVTQTPEIEDEEILDLINFVDEEIDKSDVPAPELSEEVAESPELNVPDTTFDESLDLVMDSDASDYYSESAESDENRLLREEMENELSVDDTPFEPAIASALDTELDDLAEDIPVAPELEDLISPELEDTQDEVAFEDLSSDDAFSSLEPADTTDDAEDLAAELESMLAEDSDFDTVETDDVTETSNISETSEDGDMDLVKSLLADLMDEPESEDDEDGAIALSDDDEFEAFSDETTDAENILDEILYQSMEDETAISEMSEDAVDPEESELAQIARTAREAAATPYQSAPDTRAEDKVELPERNIEKKLNLGAAGGFVGVAAGAAIGAAGRDEPSEDLDAQVSQMVEEELELEDIEELLDLIEENETDVDVQEAAQHDEDQAALATLIEEVETPQENEDMGRAAKKEALVDEDIEQESTEAFAALSHVVQEKAEMEENGPPIGDLVQDALRPMLKEWLDKNLKGIVERAVTKEVKRISSGK